jgi:glycolate oxidase
MNRLFTETDLEVMRDVRDVFNPDGLCSPKKLLPVSAGCGNEHIERKSPSRRAM